MITRWNSLLRTPRTMVVTSPTTLAVKTGRVSGRQKDATAISSCFGSICAGDSQVFPFLSHHLRKLLATKILLLFRIEPFICSDSSASSPDSTLLLRAPNSRLSPDQRTTSKNLLTDLCPWQPCNSTTVLRLSLTSTWMLWMLWQKTAQTLELCRYCSLLKLWSPF